MAYRKKRTYRRRPRYRSARRVRRQRGKMTSYDGVYYSKCITTVPFTYDAAVGGQFLVGWGQAGVSNNNAKFIDDNAEFNELTTHFGQWRIKGVKMIFSPLSNVTAVAGSYTSSMQIASDPTQTPSFGNSDNWFQKQVDYKSYASTKSIYKYVNLQKFFGKSGYEWMDTSTFYPAAGTLFRLDTQGYGSGDAVGTMQIIWYVAFKAFGL